MAKAMWQTEHLRTDLDRWENEGGSLSGKADGRRSHLSKDCEAVPAKVVVDRSRIPTPQKDKKLC
jgi:hypothetical protein